MQQLQEIQLQLAKEEPDSVSSSEEKIAAAMAQCQTGKCGTNLWMTAVTQTEIKTTAELIISMFGLVWFGLV